jgi:hypothetical protein
LIQKKYIWFVWLNPASFPPQKGVFVKTNGHPEASFLHFLLLASDKSGSKEVFLHDKAQFSLPMGHIVMIVDELG